MSKSGRRAERRRILLARQRGKDGKAAEQKEQASPALFEELEPRILFSTLTGMDQDASLLDADYAAGGEVIEADLAPDAGDASADVAAESLRHELVFVDTGVVGHEQLVEDIRSAQPEGRELEVVLLDGEQDGIEQITDFLRDHEGLDAIHIVSHGSDGAAQLGNAWLTSESLSSYEEAIGSWADALSDEADLLFYGCDLAAGEGGEALVGSLAKLTGADVAASSDLTGAAALGGDWDLEYQRGDIEASLAVSAAAQESWDGVLANTAPTFGVGDGSVTTAVGAANDDAQSMVVQPDGKILVAGFSYNGTNNDFAITRYNADGTLDSSFDSDGVVTMAIGSGADKANSITLQPDGKILVAGQSSNGSNDDFALIRLNADGSLDTSFDGDGVVTTAIGAGADAAQGVVVQDDGKILVIGRTNNGTDNDFAIARYNADGSLDTSFDGDGIATTAIGSGDDRAFGVSLQTDGKILVAGRSNNGTNNDFALVRYNTDGSLDTGFDTDGKLTTDFSSGNDTAYSVTVQTDGKILVAGEVRNTNDDFGLARYNTDGSLDTSFDGDGLVSTAIGSFFDRAQSVTLQTDGKILVAGYSGNGSDEDFALVRYDTDGSLDTSFNGTGMVATDFGTGNDRANSVAVQADGTIVLTGRSHNGTNQDFALVSYNADGSLATTFDESGSGILSANSTFVEGGALVVLDSDVTIFDAELSVADNFDGATLTLTRNGGTNADDVFTATGTLGALTQGGNLVVGATTIGTVTTNSAGALVLTLDSNATNTLVNQAMQQISYENTSDAPPASVQIDWTFDDGNSGAQGSGGALQANGSVTVDFVTQNDAPILHAWYDAAWEQRKVVTIDAANVDGDLTDFPVLITLIADTELATLAQADGDDIVFTAADGTTKLAHEIGDYDPVTGALTVWVKADLSASTDTTLFLYYGNSAAANQQDTANVWDVNYIGVWHLEDTPTGVVADITDSTANNNHGTTEGAMNAVDSVSAKIGRGLDFDEIDDLIRMQDSPSLDSVTDEATFELWIWFDDAVDGDHQIIMTSSNRYAGLDGYEWASQGDGDHFFYPDAGLPDTNYNLGPNPFTDQQWHHLAMTMDFDTKDMNIYVDGVAMTFTTEGVPGSWSTLTSSDDWLWGGNPDRATRFFDGVMDEIRVSDVIRSQEWMQTSINNQSNPSSFFSVGSVETRDLSLTDVNEDDTNPSGDTVVNILNSGAGDRITDPDAGALEGVAVVGVDDTNGQWQYDSTGGGTWVAFGVVSDSAATLLDTDAKIRFVPNPNYNGTAGDLTIRAWDQTSGSNGQTGVSVSSNGGNTAFSSDVETASLSITPINDAPTAVNDTATVDEGASVLINLAGNDTDPDNALDLTSIVITSSPSNGTLVDNNDGTFTYTHDGSETVGDSLSYTIDDASGATSNVASVTVDITAIDDPPVITSDGGGPTANVNVAENTTTVTTVTATDAELDTPTFTISGGADQGLFSIDLNSGVLTFDTAPDFQGLGDNSYEVEVTADDGNGETDVQTISVTVTNVAPNANADGSWFDETDGGVGFGSFAELADAHAAYLGAVEQTIDLESLPAATPLSNQFTGSHGVTFSNSGTGSSGIYVEGGAWIENITGYDGSFAPDGSNVYLKMDNDVAATPFTIEFDSPVAEVGALVGMGKEGVNHSLTVSLYDAAGDLIDQQTFDAELWDQSSPDQNFETFFAAKFDSAIISKVEILNSSNVDFANALVFDQLSWSHTASAADAFVAKTAVALTTGDVLADDADPAGGAISVSGFTQSANGTVAYNGDGTFTYTSDAGFTGTDTFDYTIADGDGGFDTAMVSILVTNDSPIITSDGGGATANLNVAENTTTVTTVSASDPDGHTPAFSISGGADAALFGIDVNSGVLTFDVAPDFEGPGDNLYEVIVRADDGNGGFDTQTINVSVTDVSSNLVVTTVANVSDGDVSSAEALNASKGADGFVSLSEAITAANNSAETVTIRFEISEPLVDGMHTFTIGAGGLPAITDSVIIDGTTDSHYAGNPVIRIDGSSAGAGVNGLSFASTSDGSVVRGLMVTGFTGYGIQVDSGADGITIANNWIGTTGTGSTGVGNNNSGINIQGANTIVGGTGLNDGNVITNNGNEGINVTGAGATGTIIQGNIVGLDPDGSTGAGNSDVGIALLSGAHNTAIGGTTAAARNIISNNYEGIEINSNNNVVQGNYIGVDGAGTADRGNRSDDGVEIQSGATGNLIGGTELGAGNLIAFNALDGVNVVSGSGNSVLGNRIHSNSGLGIDLGPNGVTTNDADDADTGANALQNFPVITSAELSGTDLTLSGTLDSDGVNSQYRIEFFGIAAGAQDATNGEAPVYLGTITVIADGMGDATFSNGILSGIALSPGDHVTATATLIDDPGQVGIDDQLAYGSTSELAANVVVTLSNVAPTAVNDTASVNEGASVLINLSGNDTDPENALDLTSIVITSDPINGTLVDNNNGTYTYIHNGSETLGDSFSYTIDDASGATSNVASVTLTVIPQNDAPTAVNDTASVNEGASVLINLSGNDSDPDNALDLTSIVITSDPINGTLVDNNNGTYTYTHNGSETVGDSFSYTIDDASGATSNIASVTLTVTPVNDAPLVLNQTLTIAENEINGTLIGTMTASDAEPGPLVYTIQAGNNGGAFAIDAATGDVTVANSAAIDYETNSSFALAVEARDSGGLASQALLTINVQDLNEAPAMPGNTFTVMDTTANGGMVGVVGANDPDAGDTLLYAIIGGNTGGTFSIDPATGEIRVANAAALDPVALPSYDLVIEARDSANLSGTVVVTIGVEEPPSNVLQFNPDDLDTSNDDPSQVESSASDDGLLEDDQAEDTEAGNQVALAPPPGMPTSFQSLELESNSRDQSAGRSVLAHTEFRDRAEEESSLEDAPEFENEEDVKAGPAQTPQQEFAARQQLEIQLDLLREEIEREGGEAASDLALRVGATEGALAATFTGVLGLLMRGSSIVAAMLSSLPLWRRVDPLAVLTVSDEQREALAEKMREAARREEEEAEGLAQVLDRDEETRHEAGQSQSGGTPSR